jgi:aminoglycoside 6'-N-acetyltransferase I
VIDTLEASWLTLPEAAALPGYVCVVSRTHVVELHDLTEPQAMAFMRDLRRASYAVAAATGAITLNVEIHSNTLPHLHADFHPRHHGDVFEGRPIDPRSVTRPVYAPGEYAALRDRVQAALAPPAPAPATPAPGASPGIAFRVLTAADAVVLERVAEDVFDQAVRADLATSYLADPRKLLAVAVADGVVVGMASGIVYEHPDKPLQLWVNEVGTAPPWQRRGIATGLVKLLLARGREMGCTEAWVATERNNAPARALYESLGGRPDDDLAVVYTYRLDEEKGA